MSVDLAYIFPNILPEDGFVFPLVQLFDQLFFLRPVEDDLPETDSSLLHALTAQQEENKIIHYFCPARLGRDRDNFLGLLRDIHSRPEDYTGHLAQLSAGFVPAVQEDEREHSIISTLLYQTGIQPGSREHTPESGKGQEKNAAYLRLWQARMLLKLGESVDRQHIEIRRNLDRTVQEQKELLRELHREEDAPDFALPTTLPNEEISLEQARLRLKAWSRLFVLSASRSDTIAFITQDSDAFEALLDCYQQKYPGTPQKLFSLPLPLPVVGNVGDDENADEVLDRRNRFQEDAGALLTEIRELPTRPDSVLSDKIKAVWGDLLERHYPEAEHGRCFLTLYYLADVVPQRLFLETFARQDNYSGQYHEKTGMFLGIMQKEDKEEGENEVEKIRP